jgi:hypothetical protein
VGAVGIGGAWEMVGGVGSSISVCLNMFEILIEGLWVQVESCPWGARWMLVKKMVGCF